VRLHANEREKIAEAAAGDIVALVGVDCASGDRAEVPLVEMFGYSMGVRSLSSGQANFSMEFATHRQVPASEQKQLIQKAAE
jgi:translation elongation factor EF-G